MSKGSGDDEVHLQQENLSRTRSSSNKFANRDKYPTRRQGFSSDRSMFDGSDDGNAATRTQDFSRNRSFSSRDGNHDTTPGPPTAAQQEPRVGARQVPNLYASEANSFLTPAPISIPFTNAGSEFLYGTFAVKAALQASRRQLYKLYIYHGSSRTEKPDPEMRRLAGKSGVKIVDVGEDWIRLLSRMTDNRPHNGYVLEASPPPRLPVTALRKVEKLGDPIKVKLGQQSAEARKINDVFSISESTANIPVAAGSETARYPFLILVDGVRDPGNLGAIIRSAYFLGADGLIVLEHSTAPLTATTLKASGGAAEVLPILSIQNETDFIKTSKENGWKFVAAVAPFKNKKGKKFKDEVKSALSTAPFVLMMGNEGEGLRPRIEKMADHTITIQGRRKDEVEFVDSLNVSVATALLTQQFLEGLGNDNSANESVVSPKVMEEKSKEQGKDNQIF